MAGSNSSFYPVFEDHEQIISETEDAVSAVNHCHILPPIQATLTPQTPPRQIPTQTVLTETTV